MMENSAIEKENTSPVSATNASSLKPLWLVLLYLVLAAYLYSFSEYGLNVWDEGGYANGTLRTLNGETAMEDFNPSGYPPGRYIYGVLFFKLFGVTLQSLRIGVILLTPAMIFMVYVIARRIMSSGFAFLAAVFMLSAPAMYYNRFFTFFIVLNLFCLVRCVGRVQPQRYLYLAGAVLLSGFFKFEVALLSFFCSAVVFFVQFIVRRKKLKFSYKEAGSDFGMSRTKLWISAGLMVMVLIFGLSFLLEKDFFNLAVEMVFGSYQVWGNPFPDLWPWNEFGVHEMFQRLLYYIPIWIYAGVAGFLVIKVIRKNAIDVFDLHVLSILSIGICAYGLVLWRAGFDNLLRTLPPAYILFCYVLCLFRGSLLSLSTILIVRSGIVEVLRKININIMTVFLPFLFFYEMNVNHGFYAGTIGAVRQETVLVDMAKMKVYTNPAEAKWITQVVDRIEIYSEENDSILALPLNPIFYFLTGRINPTPYDWILPGMLNEEEEREVIRKLRANPPKVIVFVDIPIDGKEDRRLARYTPLIYGYIMENYALEEMIGMFQILLPQIKDQKT